MNKIIIGGSGRSGTSMLMKMLIDLGFVPAPNLEANERSYSTFVSAGFEETVEDTLSFITSSEVEVLKTPLLYEIAEMDSFNAINVGLVIIPVREVFMASMSRCVNEMVYLMKEGKGVHAAVATSGKYTAGVSYAIDCSSQEELTSLGLSHLVYQCSKKGVAMCFVPFPEVGAGNAALSHALKPYLKEKGLPVDSVDKWLKVNFDPNKVMPVKSDMRFEDPGISRFRSYLDSKLPLSGEILLVAIRKFVDSEIKQRERLQAEIKALQQPSLRGLIKKCLREAIGL